MTPPKRPVVAVVDPVSTGSQLAEEFAGRGWDTVAVFTPGQMPAAYRQSFRPEGYRAVIDLGSVADPAAEVSRHQPSLVITGSEWGVRAADELAERLCLLGNGTRLSPSRRDKYAMVEQLRQAGVDAAESIACDDVEKMIDWADAGGHWPLVVKPLASAGSDSVAICADEAQARAAFARIHRRSDQMGNFNELVLAQECLAGAQYFVNTVSRDGRHFVHEIWREQRASVDGAVVYDYQDLLAPDGDPQRDLAAYVARVLDALGIAHGPAHAEVMLTARGPVLIEIGARLEGAVTSRGPRAATGHSQVSLTVDAYTDPAAFARLPGTDYRLLRSLRVVCLIAAQDGHLAAGPLAQVRALPSYLCGSTDLLAGGDEVRRTVDLFSSPGHLYLLGDREQIEHDYRRVREIEQAGLYQGEPAG